MSLSLLVGTTVDGIQRVTKLVRFESWTHRPFSRRGSIYSGSNKSAHILNLLNEFGGKEIKCEACRAFYLFHNEFNKFNNTRARMLDSIYHMTILT